MGLFEELSLSYPLEEVEPYGRVLVVPSKLFRLEGQAYQVSQVSNRGTNINQPHPA